ncbi:GNAT family N-acetyltransferase [Halalkalibacter lacteus]|uniref:GNAT family N-acetyltransferase n=1 Tax=Halalkalibacter lacteus TaxID=3090663 RepID=UPI002FCB638B
MIDVREVKKEEIQPVSQFLLKTMGEVYPFPLSEASMRDLNEMATLFIKRKDATILAAFLNGKVVGTIAVRPYDGRITSLGNRYNLQTTCEIIKCYVDKDSRKQGIGTLLLEAAIDFCKQARYSTIYLHTHRFLPGGLTFWKKKGFQITLDEQGELETIHMEQKIGNF